MTMYVNPIDEQTADDRAVAAATIAERRAEQLKRKFVTQMTPWSPGVPSVPFDVIIEDLSERGVGVVHDYPLSVGIPHLLTVPRGDQGRAIIREYVVVRCNQRGDGKYAIRLEISTTPQAKQATRKTICSKNVKLLFLALGVAGLLAATFLPLN